MIHIKKILRTTAIVAVTTNTIMGAPDSSSTQPQNTENSESVMPVINKDIIQGRWEELKGKVKQQWGKLTDDDILKMKGSTQELRGILQQKYGYKKDRVEKEIEKFLEKNKQESDK